MDYIVNILLRIKEKPACYLGEKSIINLSILLGGYIQAVEDITNERLNFNSIFQKFIETKFGRSAKHWSKILLEKYSDSIGFDMFFEYFNEFLNLNK